MARSGVLLAAAAVAAAASRGSLGGYAPNWSQYRSSPYTFSVQDIAPLAPVLDNIIWSFVYFCPPPGTNPMPYWAVAPYGSCSDATAFQLMSVDPSDGPALQALAGMRASNPNLRVAISIGGWNFPSAYFSQMAGSAASRQTFAQSVASWIEQYSLDGVDIDWEAPCSAPRTNAVEIDCSTFRDVSDAGGSCPQDTQNIVQLMQDLRAAIGPNKTLSVATQAGSVLESDMAVNELVKYADLLHVMTYDYSVSDITNAGGMAPNAPLYAPNATGGIQTWSINSTIANYLAAGVPPQKMAIGIPLYGHVWYNPTITGNAWQQFGNPSVVQGKCCGPLQATNGGAPGQGAQQCGTYMYSEIQAAAPTLKTFDVGTQSDIAFFETTGADGYTAPGTWITYNDVDSVKAITQYAIANGLAGVFVFDVSMDSISGGSFDFTLTNTIAAALGGR